MPTKDELLQEAKDAGVEGADDMTKKELEAALEENGAPEQAKHAMAGQSEPYSPQQRRHQNLAS